MGFEQEELELAFQLHVMDMLVQADLVTTQAERDHLESLYPLAMLIQQGFSEADGTRTERLQDAAMEALEVLPRTLDGEQKLALLDTCYQLAISDRSFGMGEGSVLLMAARLLGIPDATFDDFVDRRGGPPGMTSAQLDREDG